MSTPTPTPYVVGGSLHLTVTRTNCDHITEAELPVTIIKTFKVSMSPVMVVTFNTGSGPMTAALKLYDRRFGPDFRDVAGKYKPHTSEDEKIWREYVQAGMAAPFFHQLEKDEAEAEYPVLSYHYYEDSWEGRAQYEGALQRRVLKYFDVETKAYDILYDLQGTCIPAMLAHVRVSQPLPYHAENEVYFGIPGILLQFIDGCNLGELNHYPRMVPKMDDLRRIVQTAVNTAYDINDRGVLMLDCRPGNILVEWESGRPFFHDFAQCDFKDDFDPEDPWTYEDAVRQRANPEGLRLVMTKLVKQQRHVNLGIQCRNDRPR